MSTITHADALKYIVAKSTAVVDAVADSMHGNVFDEYVETLVDLTIEWDSLLGILGVPRSLGELAYSSGLHAVSRIELPNGNEFHHVWHPDTEHPLNQPREVYSNHDGDTIYTVAITPGRQLGVTVSTRADALRSMALAVLDAFRKSTGMHREQVVAAARNAGLTDDEITAALNRGDA